MSNQIYDWETINVVKARFIDAVHVNAHMLYLDNTIQQLVCWIAFTL